MSATAIVISFVINTTHAAFCTTPMPLEQAQAQVQVIAPDMGAWMKAHPGFTAPNVIVRGQPNYTDALAGKIEDDPLTGNSTTIPPCKPFS